MKIIRVQKIKVADQFFKRLQGYMFKSKPQNTEVLIIESCNSIHTFFMKFEIDVLFLDQDNRVVEIKHALKRRQVIASVKGACKVAEASSGLFLGIEKGELIRFETY